MSGCRGIRAHQNTTELPHPPFLTLFGRAYDHGMSDVIITVRGEHETRRAPEQGVVRVSVRTEGPERGPVVERLSALSQPIRDDLTSRKDAGDLAEWSSQRVSVWSNRPWASDGRQLALVHHAAVEFTATFEDFAALSWWVSEISTRDGVQIDHVAWQLTPASARETEAATAAQAVQVAVDRATAYAKALGLTTVEAREVADLGLLTRAEAAPAPEMRMMAMRASADAGGGAPAVDLQPEEIVVTAGVEARFAAR